jgi:hypothetical protein
MRYVFPIFFCCITLFCSACGTLNSVTTIEPNQTFVLGENSHLPFRARIKNIGEGAVEVLLTASKKTTSLGILHQNENAYYEAAANNVVSFKNVGTTKANIKIKLVGDTNLSMGYSK